MKLDGMEVDDANDALIVAVTKRDAESAIKKNARMCAVALAICRQMNAQEARVHASRAYVRKGRKWTRYSVPPALRTEILAFDRGGAFEPGEYTLPPVTSSQRIAQAARSPKPKKRAKRSSKNSVRHYHKVPGVRQTMKGKMDWE